MSAIVLMACGDNLFSIGNFNTPSCPGTQARCGADCVDVASDVGHCGSCGQACLAAQVCEAGVCKSCNTGGIICSGVCTDLHSDANHCGSCDNTCAVGKVCAGGVCTCPSGRIDCAGACVDVKFDHGNCGQCGLSCAAKQCVGGVCQICTVSFAPAVSYPAGPTPYSVAVGDLDKDGLADVVTPNGDANTVGVLMNLGGGKLGPSRILLAGVQPHWAAIGDVVGNDARPDVAVTNWSTGTVSVFSGHGDGSFSEPFEYVSRVYSGRIVIDELNGDYRKDLVVGNDSDFVSVFLNVAATGFGTGVDYPVEQSAAPRSIAVGDLNGDQWNDIVTTNQQARSITVLFNDKHGGFVLGPDYRTGLGPVAVAISDVNRDGALDVVCANADAENISVLINKGNGVFMPAVQYPVGTAPSALSVVDLNGDMAGDLVYSGFNTGVVSVLPNLGDGTFAGNPINFKVQDRPVLGVGELDGDGKIDVVTANQSSNSVSVLINQSRCQ